MKRKFLLGLLLCAILAFPLVGCGDSNVIQVEPPSKTGEVSSVTIGYEDADITGGMLAVDLSVGTLTLRANVRKTDESVNAVVKFNSSVKDVATVTENGTVTLVGVGETVITAEAGNKKHEIVLVVGDNYSVPQQYTVTVVGGRSNISTAAPSEYVTLTANEDPSRRFVRWEYSMGGEPIADLWINGNIFAMPAGNITVTAIFEVMLYQLNVVNGTVKNLESDENADGAAVYHLEYGTEITTVADPEPSGKMFVGWDYKIKNNRVGEIGETEYGPFEMPAETLTVWAVYSDASSLNMKNKPYAYNSESRGYKKITDGTPSGETADPDLQGMSGYRFAIPANTSKSTSMDENISYSNLSTLNTGSQTVKAVFKNHHSSLPITVEYYASQYGAIVTTGEITVPAGSVAETSVIANLGFNFPSMGFAVRENIGGDANDTVLLDMVVRKAATYPDGDKQFEVSGAAQWVNLNAIKLDERGNEGYISYPGGTQSTSAPFGGRKWVNNDWGMTNIQTRNAMLTPVSWVCNQIKNLPSYDAASPTTKIYFRVINATAYDCNFKFNLGNTTNAVGTAAGDSLASYTLSLTGYEMKLFALEFARTEGDTVYFGIIKEKHDEYDNNLVIQMSYNNVIGVKED